MASMKLIAKLNNRYKLCLNENAAIFKYLIKIYKNLNEIDFF
jgi:hypothetical protein